MVRLRAFGCAAVFACVAGSAHAQWNTQQPAVMTQISARSVGVTAGSTMLSNPVVATGIVTGAGPKSWDITTTGHKGPGPAGVIDVAVKRTVTQAAVGRAIARGLPVVGTAIAIADLLNDLRCIEAFGGGVACDPGVPEQVFTGDHYCAGSSSTCATWASLHPSYTAACAEHLAYVQEIQAGLEYCVAGNPPGNHGSVVYTQKTCTASVSTVKRTVTCWAPAVPSTGTTDYTVGLIKKQSTSTKCPDITANGQTWTPVKGIDGRCPIGPGSEEEITDVDFSDKVDQHVPPSRIPAIIPELIGGNVPIDHPQPLTTPEVPSVWGDRETTTNPDGSTTVRDVEWQLGPNAGGYGWLPRVVEKTYPPGTTPPPVGDIEAPDKVVEGPGAVPGQEIITCGLPDTPPCKIDESGTPPPADPFEDPDGWFDPLRGVFENPPVADTSWSWSFSLPSSCSVLTVGTFAGHTVTLDLCQWQPMIHAILSMVWLIAGIWAGVGMVGRTLGGT